MARYTFRYTFEEILEALRRADLDQETVVKVGGGLLAVRHEKRRLGGRPPEDDSQRLALMAALVQVGVTRWQAAGIVTAELPEPARGTAKKRVYGKFGKLPK